MDSPDWVIDQNLSEAQAGQFSGISFAGNEIFWGGLGIASGVLNRVWDFSEDWHPRSAEILPPIGDPA
jgi:hypothetical protein